MNVQCKDCQKEVYVRDAWIGYRMWLYDGWDIDSETLEITCPDCKEVNEKVNK